MKLIIDFLGDSTIEVVGFIIFMIIFLVGLNANNWGLINRASQLLSSAM